ncbi:cycloartenol synthase [Thecamonas trahens ATCC 50062]|uniref:Terpene cyclase/mutase family member n=1 Tax=Thecamonas trahens ATCC 50062 TaxID=461836 RepID=A0A0L0DDB5_THETB|nr:cycloartenol synthase [Thecamonas trahens ATCC 50062]KNC50324.1 cycloartenol synthase [Thecamonas trahens ATCC 50062]|eukprot:XP_013756870.1 cycloartenol synthase [Thecamonas trahens ATCC 50062]
MVRGFDFLSAIITEDGHWANDYGGPLFLMPGLIITAYITGTELGEPVKLEMIRYLTGKQTEEGGWGLHIESPTTMFGTALNYVSMRILGVPADDTRMARARAWMRENGSALSVPSWGKFWLAVLGVYEWDGLYPVPPELWLLPEWLPLHPSRWWVHCRIVYLPMGYLYGRKAVGPITPLIVALRNELYNAPYFSIDWPAARANICPADYYTPHTTLHRALFKSLAAYEAVHSTTLRQAALDMTIDHIRAEDENSSYICIGPVNKAINMLCRFFADGGVSEAVTKHADRLADYLWLAGDGMKMQGYNGSQLWDTAFTLHAYLASPLKERYIATLDAGYEYINICQVRDNVPNMVKYYRHESKGAWPFSTRIHTHPISDCTSLALRVCLSIRQLSSLVPRADRIAPERLFDAVNVILSLQNNHANGGWATYELQRSPPWIEAFNPSETFGAIMVDYEYVECTSECVQALVAFHAQFPDHRAKEIRAAIKRGVKFIESIQLPDGSWYGSWAVCFTYGTWFGVEGLIAAGRKPTAKSLVKACAFLVANQNSDGGWGESFLSSSEKVYSPCESQVVNTAWALLALIKARHPDRVPIDAGIRYLVSKQLPDGNWTEERIKGVFNANCSISYLAYKNVFPLWALAEYTSHYPKAKL